MHQPTLLLSDYTTSYPLATFPPLAWFILLDIFCPVVQNKGTVDVRHNMLIHKLLMELQKKVVS
jgi:hypothetical protein